jgi:hypothetical protein
MKKDVLYPYGQLDVLDYYSKVSKKLLSFLNGREIASKTVTNSLKAANFYTPNDGSSPSGSFFKKRSSFKKGDFKKQLMVDKFYFLKRGSNSKPLYVRDLKLVDEKFLKLRAKGHLKDFKDELSEKQILLWQYFVSRKPMNFFYATNGEGVGKGMGRIFIDIDKGKLGSGKLVVGGSKEKEKTTTENRTAKTKAGSDDVRRVALDLVRVIKSDKEFSKLLKFKIFVMWTGVSFHVYLFLKKKIDLDFYKKYLSYGEKKEDSFIMKWAKDVSDQTGINVCAGHEKKRGAVILDSSNTPSGKLARVPFSLHLDKNGKIDGVAVPVSEKELSGKNLIKKLEKLTPDIVLKNLSDYAKLL